MLLVENSVLLRAALAPFVALCLVACTAENPDFEGSIDAGLADRPVDLARRDCGAGTAAGAACKAGERGCTADCGSGVSSLECGDKKTYVVDRACSTTATCAKGYCVAPKVQPGGTIGTSCTSEAQCLVSAQNADISCEPFVVGKVVEWRCARRIGDGASGKACTKDGDCRSGFCIPDRKACFRACSGADNDCPVLNKTQLVCRPVRINVEGVDVMSTSCVLP